MPTDDIYEAAAAYVALSEITSLPIHNATTSDGKFNACAVELVRKEVAEMRRLNLWGAL
jgi:hypothetical protein